MSPAEYAAQNGQFSDPHASEADRIVNAPTHYQSPGGRLETITVIEEFGLGFRLGNTVKYILRAGKKGNRLTDLRKAAWYLQREIAAEEAVPSQKGDRKDTVDHDTPASGPTSSQPAMLGEGGSFMSAGGRDTVSNWAGKA